MKEEIDASGEKQQAKKRRGSEMKEKVEEARQIECKSRGFGYCWI